MGCSGPPGVSPPACPPCFLAEVCLDGEPVEASRRRRASLTFTPARLRRSGGRRVACPLDESIYDPVGSRRPFFWRIWHAKNCEPGFRRQSSGAAASKRSSTLARLIEPWKSHLAKVGFRGHPARSTNALIF